ncbi:hypothetical protein CNMCM6457_005964 [Aspergillus fumigatiaffinis]|nr:hypothetical protein CNMCM6457_005964 [Aspergillus fumigatiaffinis]
MVHISRVQKRPKGHAREAEVTDYVYGTHFAAQDLPHHEMAEREMPAAVAYRLIKDELSLDGNPLLNLASFVTTYMEDEAQNLMTDSMSKNFIDYEQYPQTANIQNRCINMIADLLHAPTAESPDDQDSIGTSTVGSSEGIMLAMLAMKKRWQNRRKAEGKDSTRPNIVMNSAVQVCWEKAARYFDVEEKYVYCTETRYVIDPEEAVNLVDENTIGICAILGTTYTGQYEDVKAINDLLIKKKIDCPIHVDAASGGFVAPFENPSLEWDFRLPKVVSINVSGHKYGLVYPGVGWVFWRSAEYLPKELIFNVNYLGTEQATFTLNFSKGASNIIGQYYQLIRLGRHGYRSVMQNLTRTADHLATELQKLNFIIMSDGAGGGLPLVAYRLPPDENRLWDEYALAHVLRQRGWVIPAYTMAPHSNQLKMMRIVLREDFSMDRCNVLVEDMKMAMKTLEEMDRAMIEQYIRHSSRQSQSGKPDHPVYPGEKHSLQGKTGKTHAVANAINFTQETWTNDIFAAQAAHIDAFALNLGYGLHNYELILNDAFTVAHRHNFKMFLSFDLGQGSQWPADEIVHVIDNYATGSAYYKHHDDKPLVSTFEGGQSADVWKDVRHNAQSEFFFIPDWSSLGIEAASSSPLIDGLMSWHAWPAGAHDMNTTLDEEYIAALDGRPYIMPVSPWFYTNLPVFDKNWAWRGDDLWFDRWQQVLELAPEYVEIITWNDYGESHYIGPMHEDDLGIFAVGDAPFNYAEGMPHDGWRAFLPYVIDLYKSGGKNASFDKEGVVSWYRLNPGSACMSGKTTPGQLSVEVTNTTSPRTVMQDRIFYSALLESAADVTVSIGGASKTGSWVDTPSGQKGLYHGSVPIDGMTGEVVVTLSRAGEQIAQMKGEAITTDCRKNHGYNNWNAWVGSAMSEKNVASEKTSSNDKKSGSQRSRPAMTLLLGLVLLALV